MAISVVRTVKLVKLVVALKQRVNLLTKEL